ncbi:hypothetical protein ALC62_12925, partial [Cyphomyrmex costatus]
GQIEGKLGQMGGGTVEQSKTRHETNNPKSPAGAHTRSRSSLFALFITCRREAPSCLETRHIRYKRDKPPGRKKRRKRKKWIFFDESRYSPCERPFVFLLLLSFPGMKCSRGDGAIMCHLLFIL